MSFCRFSVPQNYLSDLGFFSHRNAKMSGLECLSIGFPRCLMASLGKVCESSEGRLIMVFGGVFLLAKNFQAKHHRLEMFCMMHCRLKYW